MFYLRIYLIPYNNSFKKIYTSNSSQIHYKADHDKNNKVNETIQIS